MNKKENFLYTVDTEQLQKVYEEGKSIKIGKFYKAEYYNKPIKPIILADGKPFDTKNNPNSKQTDKMLKTARQFADIVDIGKQSYLIKEIYDKPILIPDSNYKEYLTPLIIELLCKYCIPIDYTTEIIFDRTADDIFRELNILGNKYNFYVATKYNKALKKDFYDENFIMESGFFGYMATRLNFIIKNNIDYAIKNLPLKYAINTRQIGIVENNRLDAESDIIFTSVLNSLNACDFLLEKRANTKFMERLEKERKDLFVKYDGKEIKLSWEFRIYPDSFNESYLNNYLSNNDLLYCRDKLRISFQHSFERLCPLDMLNDYKEMIENGDISPFDGYIQQNDRGFKYDLYKLENYINTFNNEIMDCFA